MNKRKNTIFIFLILTFLILRGFGNEVFSGSNSPFTITTFDGVIDITTDKCKYKQGETVTVFITNIGEDKIEIGGPCFNVYNENRETVFSGCLFCYWKLEPGESETWYWNQIDKNWSQVPIGKYTIEGIFPTAYEDKKYCDETSIYVYKNKNFVRNNQNEKQWINHLDKQFIYWGAFEGEFRSENLTDYHIDTDFGASILPHYVNYVPDRLILEIVVNYFVFMNYTLPFPNPVAPFCGFGFKVVNYSDYVWEYFVLKHNGYAERRGNISVEISIPMDGIEKDDEIILDILFSQYCSPYLRIICGEKPLGVNFLISMGMRLLAHNPVIGDMLLKNVLFSILPERPDNYRLYVRFK